MHSKFIISPSSPHVFSQKSFPQYRSFFNNKRIRRQPKIQAPSNPPKQNPKHYSIKYLGVLEGQIGIYSKRSPIPHLDYNQICKSAPLHTIYSTYNQIRWMKTQNKGVRFGRRATQNFFTPISQDEQFVIHTYSLPKGLKSSKRPSSVQKPRTQLVTPMNRTGFSGWKLSRPKSTTPKITQKPSFGGFSERPSKVSLKAEEYYNEPYLKHLAENKGVKIKKSCKQMSGYQAYVGRISKVSNRLKKVQMKPKEAQRQPFDWKIAQLEQKIQDFEDEQYKEVTQIKNELNKVQKQVQNQHFTLEHLFQSKTRQLESVQEHLHQMLRVELNSRKQTDARILRFLDDKTASLRSEIAVEQRKRVRMVNQQKINVNQEISSFQKRINSENNFFSELEQQVENSVRESFEECEMEIGNSKKEKEEGEEAVLSMLRDIVGRLRHQIEQERKERESSEEALLSLLEDTCSKLNFLSQS